jgi:hypothetical protein
MNGPRILQGVFLTGEPIVAVIQPRARAPVIQPKANRPAGAPTVPGAAAAQPKTGQATDPRYRTAAGPSLAPASTAMSSRRLSPVHPAAAEEPAMLALSSPTTAQLMEGGPGSTPGGVRRSTQESGSPNGSRRQDETVMRTGGETAWLMSAAPPRGHGQPLPPLVQARMEALFGVSFADVRIHVGHHVSAVGALAYTHGSNLHFAPGQYNPHSTEGLKLLAHELTHVVQQREGRVKNPFGEGTAIVANKALEAEADSRAMDIAKGPPLLLWRPDQAGAATVEPRNAGPAGRSQPIDQR